MKKQFILCGLAAASVGLAFASVDKLNLIKDNKIINSIDVNSIKQISYTSEENEITELDVTYKDASKTSYSLDSFDYLAYDRQTSGNLPHCDADALDYSYLPTEEKVNSVIETLELELSNLINAQCTLLGGKDGTPLQEHYYQQVYSMTVDNYAGYFALINSTFMEGSMETTYYYTPKYTESPYGRLLNMKNDLANFLNRPETNSIVELKAVALLMFNLVAQEVTDIYGAIPYADHKNNKKTYPFTFNDGRQIYYSIVDNVDSINAVFANFESRPDWYKEKLNNLLDMYDQCTVKRNYETWRRLANSLKLRMAVHIAKYEPEVAKKWAEEAVAAGVIEAKDQQVGVFDGTAFGSRITPLQVIENSWNESRLNASLISILASLKHPYMNYLFDTNSNDIVNSATGAVLPAGSEIVGVRAGLRMEPSQQYFSNMRVAYSGLNFNNDPGQNARYMPFYILKWAEIDFLRAEGALRGWNMGGTAEFFYNRGIDNADCSDVFMFPSGDYEKYLPEYKELEEAVPYTYVDPMDDANNIQSVTKIGVKWNEADAPETKLEKIITQKYIATFPYSYEAWVDLRRVGYPYIFPVLNPTMGNDGSLSFGEIIRRIPLPFGNTQAGQNDVQDSGIEALGGPDLMSTRIFWDVHTPNI